MVNMKEKVYAALCAAFSEDEVSDSWPEENDSLHRIVYTEEDNRSYERSGAKTTKSYCRFRIDIFESGSTSASAVKVDKALAWDEEWETGLGMTRTACQDDNTAYQRHKIMRYECIVGEKDERIYGIN